MKKLFVVFLLTLLFSLTAVSPVSAYILTFTNDNNIEDAFIRFASNDSSFAETNFGGHPELLVGTYTDGLPSPWKHRAFLRFDLSSIPLGTRINTAKLRLFHQGGESSWAHTTIGAHQVLQPWSEDKITWNSQPIFVEEPLDYHVLNDQETGGTWQSWLVTPAVQSWVDDALSNFGLSLNKLEPAYPYDLQVFSSSENPNEVLRPRLALDITPPDMAEVISNCYVEGLIDNEGIVNSLLVKLPDENLSTQQDTQPDETFIPLENEIRAQAGKHIEEDTATWLLQIINFIKELRVNS